MSRSYIYCRKPDAVSAVLGDELAVLNLDSGSYLGFNATAAWVWRNLEQPRSLDNLCDGAIAEYRVDLPTCRASIGKLLSQLEAEGLISVVEG